MNAQLRYSINPQQKLYFKSLIYFKETLTTYFCPYHQFYTCNSPSPEMSQVYNLQV